MIPPRNPEPASDSFTKLGLSHVQKSLLTSLLLPPFDQNRIRKPRTLRGDYTDRSPTHSRPTICRTRNCRSIEWSIGVFRFQRYVYHLINVHLTCPFLPRHGLEQSQQLSHSDNPRLYVVSLREELPCNRTHTPNTFDALNEMTQFAPLDSELDFCAALRFSDTWG